MLIDKWRMNQSVNSRFFKLTEGIESQWQQPFNYEQNFAVSRLSTFDLVDNSLTFNFFWGFGVLTSG